MIKWMVQKHFGTRTYLITVGTYMTYMIGLHSFFLQNNLYYINMMFSHSILVSGNYEQPSSSWLECLTRS